MKVWQCPICRYVISDLSKKYSRCNLNCPRCGTSTLYFKLISWDKLHGEKKDK